MPKSVAVNLYSMSAWTTTVRALDKGIMLIISTRSQFKSRIWPPFLEKKKPTVRKRKTHPSATMDHSILEEENTLIAGVALA